MVTWLTRARIAEGLFAAAMVVVATFATRARADAHDVAIEWTAPPGCPSRDQVEARVLRLVGEGKHARQAVRARAVVANDADGRVHADVVLSSSGQEASRHVEGDSCGAVSDAIVLIVALAIDPEAAPPPSPPPPTTAPPPASGATNASGANAGTGATNASGPNARTAAANAGSAPIRRAPFVAAAARFDVGAVPAPAFGAEVAVGIAPRHVDLEVGGAIVAPATATLATRPNEGADVRIVDAGGRGCYLVLDGPFDIGPCGSLHARWMSAHGFGSSTPTDATTVFGVFALGAIGKARISSRLSLRAAAEAVFPLSRPSFFIDTAGTVYRPAGAALRTSLGVELHF